jgi:hypothetical protein
MNKKSPRGIMHVLFIVIILLTSCIGQTAPINPNCKEQVQAQPHAWLLRTPNIHFVFWGQYWAYAYYNADTTSFAPSGLEKDAYQAIWQKLIANGIFDRLSEYNIGKTELDMVNYAIDPTDDGSESIDDSTIPNKLNTAIANGDLHVPDDQSLFVIFLPPGERSSTMIKKGQGGYHAHSSYGQTNYAYAIVQYYSPDVGIGFFDITNHFVSHETYEAITDPDVASGYFDPNTTNEIGDFCQDASIMIGGIVVQQVWSEMQCKCL